jgi:hypothetical protein
MLFLFIMVDLMLSSDRYDVRLQMVAQSGQATNGHQEESSRASSEVCLYINR